MNENVCQWVEKSSRWRALWIPNFQRTSPQKLQVDWGTGQQIMEIYFNARRTRGALCRQYNLDDGSGAKKTTLFVWCFVKRVTEATLKLGDELSRCFHAIAQYRSIQLPVFRFWKIQREFLTILHDYYKQLKCHITPILTNPISESQKNTLNPFIVVQIQIHAYPSSSFWCYSLA